MRRFEFKHFEAVMSTVRPQRHKPIWIAGDKGYSYPRIRVWCERRGIFDVIPQRSDQIKREGRRGLIPAPATLSPVAPPPGRPR